MIDEGRITVERGSPEWLTLGQILAAIQIEAIERSKERDLGNFNGVPKHPLLTNDVGAPEFDVAPVSIMGLLEAYLQKLARSGKGAAARHTVEQSHSHRVPYAAQHEHLSKRELLASRDDAGQAKWRKSADGAASKVL